MGREYSCREDVLEECERTRCIGRVGGIVLMTRLTRAGWHEHWVIMGREGGCVVRG